LPNTSCPQRWGGEIHLPGERAFPSTSPGWNYPIWAPRLLEIRPQKTTRVTIEDIETELSCQGKIYFCRRVHRYMGTASTHGVDHRSAYLSLTQWDPATFTQIDEFGCAICSWLANATLGIWGWGM
jgi:hypothetical protein